MAKPHFTPRQCAECPLCNAIMMVRLRYPTVLPNSAKLGPNSRPYLETYFGHLDDLESQGRC